MTTTPSKPKPRNFNKRPLMIMGTKVILDTSECRITDVSKNMTQVGARIAFWGAVKGSALAEREQADAVYRHWRAQKTAAILEEDPKRSEWKIKAEIESDKVFLKMKAAIAQSEENVANADGMMRALEKFANLLQTRGANLRSGLEHQSDTTKEVDEDDEPEEDDEEEEPEDDEEDEDEEDEEDDEDDFPTDEDDEEEDDELEDVDDEEEESEDDEEDEDEEDEDEDASRLERARAAMKKKRVAKKAAKKSSKKAGKKSSKKASVDRAAKKTGKKSKKKAASAERAAKKSSKKAAKKSSKKAGKKAGKKSSKKSKKKQ